MQTHLRMHTGSCTAPGKSEDVGLQFVPENLHRLPCPLRASHMLWREINGLVENVPDSGVAQKPRTAPADSRHRPQLRGSSEGMLTLPAQHGMKLRMRVP